MLADFSVFLQLTTTT